MIKFLFKGLLRDKNKSLLPAIVVALGVFLTVLFYSWFNGIMESGIEFNANFSTGHVKVVSRAYAENISQKPNDLALMDAQNMIKELSEKFPDITWKERILFGGLIDVPDKEGETKAQGPAAGFGIEMLSGKSDELKRMNILTSLKKGKLPSRPGEILISDKFFDKLGIDLGDQVTLIGSTMFGEMAMYNFTVAGTVSFGSSSLDRGAIIADINDVRMALNMTDATSEILGFFKSGFYDDDLATAAVEKYNTLYSGTTNEFAPTMLTLKSENTMATMLDFSASIGTLITFIFVLVMSIVLWNAGLLGGLRRYSEFGVRLAIGEEKKHIFRTLIMESVLVGIIGSAAGTLLGLLFAYYLQNHGVNLEGMMENSTIMLPTVFRAKVTATTWFIGFIPGVLSTVLGASLAGIGIFKRKTASLFKELET